MKKILVALMCMMMIFAFTACGDSTSSDNEQTTKAATEAGPQIDENVTTLTINGEASENGNQLEGKTYSADDLEALGTDTVTYSFRNKKVQNERQFADYTGVDLKTVLTDAGVVADDVEDAVLKVTCSDGYTNEYEVDELYDDKYAFANNDTDEKTPVGAMIAIEKEEGDYPSPFRIVFGQADYDKCDNSAQDFNAQNWGSYIQIIDVSFPED